MSEQYTFSSVASESPKSNLNEREMETLKKLHLSSEDLQGLLSGEPIAQGSYAMIFDLPESNTVAKVWKNPQRDSDRAETEHVALRILRKRKYPYSPNVKGYVEDPRILFETKEYGKSSQEFDDEVLDQLAIALAELHSIELFSYGKPLTERKKGTQFECLIDGIKTLENKLAEATGSQEDINSIQDAIEKLKIEAGKNENVFTSSKFTLIHFDLNPNNILYSRGDQKLTILDWEQASAGDNSMDIAKLFFKSKFDEQQKRKFLSEYKKKLQQDDPGLDSRIKVYDQFVRINSVLWRLDVLASEPNQHTSIEEREFYQRVKDNLDTEVKQLKNVNEGPK